MSAKFSDAFTKDELSKELCGVFDCGIASYGLFVHQDAFKQAKCRILRDAFVKLLVDGLPRIMDVESESSVKEYLKEKEKQEHGDAVLRY